MPHVLKQCNNSQVQKKVQQRYEKKTDLSKLKKRLRVENQKNHNTTNKVMFYSKYLKQLNTLKFKTKLV